MEMTKNNAKVQYPGDKGPDIVLPLILGLQLLSAVLLVLFKCGKGRSSDEAQRGTPMPQRKTPSSKSIKKSTAKPPVTAQASSATNQKSAKGSKEAGKSVMKPNESKVSKVSTMNTTKLKTARGNAEASVCKPSRTTSVNNTKSKAKPSDVKSVNDDNNGYENCDDMSPEELAKIANKA